MAYCPRPVEGIVPFQVFQGTGVTWRFAAGANDGLEVWVRRFGGEEERE